ncbi:hypothetical protein SAMN05443292_2642 [Halpernia frigidisoli]|uniref:Uncharacterized protein n=2 Tax=Halpernia frigidisoli TaxID=1125876 RepID=A0A1I3IJA4_9FLAO|nr:hypothetical protein SAMN05443292_2642 [Halpernia frigidisoli]
MKYAGKVKKMKKNNRDLFMIVFIILIMIIYKFISPSKSENSYLDQLRKKDIKSTIYKKTIDFENHGIPYIIYNKKDSIIIYREWENKIQVNDSIIKPKGSLKLIIKNLNNVKRFDYENQDLKLPNP